MSACVVYESEDYSIHCLKQSGIATHAASCISQLIAEMLAAPDDDDDDPFLASDDNENEWTDCWKYGLTSPSYTYSLAQDIYCV